MRTEQYYMLIREGTVVQGDNIYLIEAKGSNLEELEADASLISVNRESLGDTVTWDDSVFEKNEIQVRSEVFEVVRDISRQYRISVQRDSMLPGDNKWLAAHRECSAYGKTQEAAVEAVVKLIKMVAYKDYV